MNRLDLKLAVESILDGKEMYSVDLDELQDARNHVSSQTSPDEAFDLAEECYKPITDTEGDIDDLVDWITDNFEVENLGGLV